MEKAVKKYLLIFYFVFLGTIVSGQQAMANQEKAINDYVEGYDEGYLIGQQIGAYLKSYVEYDITTGDVNVNIGTKDAYDLICRNDYTLCQQITIEDVELVIKSISRSEIFLDTKGRIAAKTGFKEIAAFIFDFASFVDEYGALSKDVTDALRDIEQVFEMIDEIPYCNYDGCKEIGVPACKEIGVPDGYMGTLFISLELMPSELIYLARS